MREKIEQEQEQKWVCAAGNDDCCGTCEICVQREVAQSAIASMQSVAATALNEVWKWGGIQAVSRALSMMVELGVKEEGHWQGHCTFAPSYQMGQCVMAFDDRRHDLPEEEV